VSTKPRDLPDLRSGVWRHYKGPLYLVLGYGHDANDPERDTVVYIGLELDDAHPGGRIATRNAVTGPDAFHDLVCSSHGVDWFTHDGAAQDSTCRCEHRFEYVSPQYLVGHRDAR
jgi:hypothetical protein